MRLEELEDWSRISCHNNIREKDMISRLAREKVVRSDSLNGDLCKESNIAKDNPFFPRLVCIQSQSLSLSIITFGRDMTNYPLFTLFYSSRKVNI